MAYQKQGFTDGETLFAEQLERIEQGIIDHEKNMENPHNVTAQQVGARPVDWTPTAAEVGAATPQDVNNAKTEAVTAAQTYTDQQVKKAAPRNLMDNSDFNNTVNQRGNQSYTEVGYTIDRWFSYAKGLTVKLQDGYLELINTTDQDVFFIQKLSSVLPAGKRITLAFGLQDDSKFSQTGVIGGSSTCNMALEGYSVYYNVSSRWITFHMHAKANVKLKWVALYEGEYTIDTLPEYQSKGYGAELAECRRYYRKSWVGSLGEMVPNGAVSFVCSSGASSQPVVSWDTPMVRTPTSNEVAIYSWVGGKGCVRDWVSSADVSGVAIDYISPFGFALTKLSGLTAGKVYAFHYEASADL